MHEIVASPISARAFAPFGDVLLDDTGALAPWNGRPEADSVLEKLVACQPAHADGHVMRLLERHRHSTQAFFPLDADAYLVATAPTAPDGTPQLDRLVAFVVPAGSVIQYRPDVWHAPLTTLGADGRFAMHIFKDGSEADCEFFQIPPVAVRLEAAQRAHGPHPTSGPAQTFPINPIKE